MSIFKDPKCPVKASILAKVVVALSEAGITDKVSPSTFEISPNLWRQIRLFLADFLKIKQGLIVLNDFGRKITLPEAKMIVSKEESFLANLFGFNETLEKVKSKLPKAKREYDQFFATTDTVIRRAELMLKKGDLTYRSILLLGDDDFLSTILIKFPLVTKITVLDIDKDVLEIIEEETKGKVSTILADLRKELPKELRANHDHVFTDPPYTLNGFNLFLNRALESLSGEKNNSIYICYGATDEARDRAFAVQDLLSESGLLISEKLDSFNKYLGAETIGSQSSLYIVKKTLQTKDASRIKGGSRIYTYE